MHIYIVVANKGIKELALHEFGKETTTEELGLSLPLSLSNLFINVIIVLAPS